MLSPKNVIYGFCLFTIPKKDKYLISLYRGSDLDIIACFSTSQQYHITKYPHITHGKVKNEKGEIVAYVFDIGHVVGKTTGNIPFAFPKRTIIPFDYCFQNKSQQELIDGFNNPRICFVLSEEEYIEILYSMYRSKYTPIRYKKIFEKILNELCV
ncbi:hypothetical protein [Bacteroides sp. 519]|uniref:hypothetical protein n=1 Tax=Bacteroides sp. 519 TaxID=2302937 RepID=UPI0013D57985|nr:hypothetical protein [Bacteroides sp. 519]NDV58276.1 hypothetical protein [Bacteroides sp. 519]